MEVRCRSCKNRDVVRYREKAFSDFRETDTEQTTISCLCDEKGRMNTDSDNEEDKINFPNPRKLESLRRSL